MDTGRPQRSCKKTTFYREDFWVPETRTKKNRRERLQIHRLVDPEERVEITGDEVLFQQIFSWNKLSLST